MKLSTRGRRSGLDGDGRPQLADRGGDLVAHDVDAAEVDVGEVARLVAHGVLGPLEPGDGFVEPAQLDQVGADVVVRVAEVGVDLDGAQALGRGLLEPTLERVRPAEERVRLGGGARGDGAPVGLDGALEVAGDLLAVGLAP